jgi:hypothetical protein
VLKCKNRFSPGSDVDWNVQRTNRLNEHSEFVKVFRLVLF